MDKEYLEKRMAVLDDIEKFATTEASKRIIDIAENADLDQRECIAVLIKSAQTILMSGFAIAMKDGLHPDMVQDIMNKMSKTIDEFGRNKKEAKAH